MQDVLSIFLYIWIRGYFISLLAYFLFWTCLCFSYKKRNTIALRWFLFDLLNFFVPFFLWIIGFILCDGVFKYGGKNMSNLVEGMFLGYLPIVIMLLKFFLVIKYQTITVKKFSIYAFLWNSILCLLCGLFIPSLGDC